MESEVPGPPSFPTLCLFPYVSLCFYTFVPNVTYCLWDPHVLCEGGSLPYFAVLVPKYSRNSPGPSPILTLLT